MAKHLFFLITLLSSHILLSKDLKIVSFGASVTEQRNSIWDNFVRILNERTGSCHTHEKFGYGACKISYTSVSKIDLVLSSSPDICILDWFDLNDINLQEGDFICLEAVVRKLRLSSCKVIFYFHLRGDNHDRLRAYFKKFKVLAKKYDIFWYDELEEFENIGIKPSEKIFRDTVHTTDYGAYYLGSLFCDFFIKNFDNIMSQLNTLPPDNMFNYVQELFIDNEMINNNVFKDEDDYWVLNSNDKISIDIAGKVISFDIKIGPYSPWINTKIDGNNKEYLIWDQWCHYERSTNKMFLEYIYSNLTLSILKDKKIDYSQAKRDFDFTGIEYLVKIKSIFFIPMYHLL